MKHDYTDEEIKKAWKDSLSLRAFLDALPERPQAAEIASLSLENERLEAELAAAHSVLDGDPSEIIRNAAQGYPEGRAPRELTLAERVQALCKYAADYAEWHKKAQAELAALRQPILDDDGRSLGQVQGDAWRAADNAGHNANECDEISAQAVAAVVLAQAVRRMEAVTAVEVADIIRKTWLERGAWIEPAAEAIRARLIAAAKGEGQPQPVVVNEPPQDERQPDLSGESEKQADPAWIPHDGGPCPLKDEEVEEWQAKWISGAVDDYKDLAPSYAAGWDGSIIAYRVLRWKPGFGPEAKAEPYQPWTPAVGDTVRSIPEMALGGQMYWRDLALQIARVWWKCHNIGASLQHGDLDKDIAFSIVCERHGGRVFHSDTPENAWNKAEEWLLSPDRENFSAACLTPAQP